MQITFDKKLELLYNDSGNKGASLQSLQSYSQITLL